jgi:hypothetical protein
MSGFLLMILLVGTRRGERKAKLSSRDLGTLTEIVQDEKVQDATITNLRVLYVVAQEDDRSDKESLARHYCKVAKRNGAWVELVRIVEIDQSSSMSEGKPSFVLLGECNCALIRVR